MHTGRIMDPEPDAPDSDPGTAHPTDPHAPTPDATAETARPNRRMRVATVLMALASVALAVSAVLFLVPVSNPGVQNCGAPAWFLLTAETDRPLVDSEGQAVNGWNEQRLRRAHEERCSVRVADRAVPAGALLGGFWIVGLGALIVGWTGRRSLRRSVAPGHGADPPVVP